jgi:DNA modification methylase
MSATMTLATTPDLTIDLVPMRAILRHPRNPREITPRDFELLVRSIRERPDFLMDRPVLVQRSTGYIYAGNMRYQGGERLLELGEWPKVYWVDGTPCIPGRVRDVSDDEALFRAMLDNNTFGDYQEQETGEILHELATKDFDLELLGFDPRELDLLLAQVGSGTPDDGAEGPFPDGQDEAEVASEPVTQVGDLWLLGPHRLLCGDATDPRDWERLMGGSRAAVCLTDPPYNVGLHYGDKVDDRRHDYPSWSRRWFEQATGHAGRVALTCGLMNLPIWYAIAEPWTVGAWVKGGSATAFSRVAQSGDWEPILFYGSPWPRDRHTDTFLYSPSAAAGLGNADGKHPAAKAPAFWTELVRSYSAAGELLVDPFLGSGTTIKVAENLRRRVFGIEIMPGFCDAIVEWWRSLGREAELVRGD